MRPRILVAFSLIVLSCAMIVRAQAPQKVRIEGTVVNARTGSPIPGARVSVSAGIGNARVSLEEAIAAVLASGATPDIPALMNRGANNPAVTTASDGAFSFELDPGAYRVIADLNDYAPGELGLRGSAGFGRPIFLDAGKHQTGLTIQLTPTGTITGRIVDAAGMPAQEVPVAAVRAGYNGLGQKSMVAGAVGSTNDRGEFRLYGVREGKYNVLAGTVAGRILLPENVTPVRENLQATPYALSYFPGVEDLGRAELLTVQAGGEVVANMSVNRVTRYSVSGRVVDSQTGTAPASASIGLIHYSPTGGNQGIVKQLRDGTGTFIFSDVIPALYTLSAQATPTQQAAPGINVPVQVTGNIENLVVTVVPPTVLGGRLTLNGAAPADLPNRERLRVGLRPFTDAGVMAGGPSAPVAADGTFRFAGILEGRYKFAITGLPAGFYAEKAELGAVDLLSGPISISPSSSGSLNVVLQRATGSLSGTVTDAQATAAPGIQVVLVPDNRQRHDLYKTTIAGSNGRFTFAEVAPGTYRVFSWEAVERYGYYDPEVLKRDNDRGQSVQLSPFSTATANVRVIPFEP